jgi:multidrug resistance efflux pump
MIKWFTILLALAGVSVAFYTVATVGNDTPPRPAPAAPPSVNPFARGVAAAGTIESASRNIPVAAPESGLVTSVQAQVGQQVKKGEALLTLDGRLLEADLVRAEAGLAVARAELAQLRAAPREEDLPPLRAAVDRARARLADLEDMLNEVMSASTKGGVSTTEVSRRRFAVNAAKADLDQAMAQLAQVQAGTWAPAITVAEARVAQAAAEVQSIRAKLDRLIVRAPCDATVLKRNVEPGQFASFGPGSPAALVLGDLSTLRVRARVDEEDSPQVRPGAKAVARVRGVQPEDLPLRMLRIEPLAQPKNELLGTTTERVDTRVVEVVFEVVGTPRSRIYPGQAVDVFIEAALEPEPASSAPATPTKPATPADAPKPG